MWLRAWYAAAVATVVSASFAYGGICSFSSASCTSDTDCGIPGVCYVGVDGPVCHHKCASDADCTTNTFCFQNGEIGGICVGCRQAGQEDNSKCTAYEKCQRDDCKQFCHTECTA